MVDDDVSVGMFLTCDDKFYVVHLSFILRREIVRGKSFILFESVVRRE